MYTVRVHSLLLVYWRCFSLDNPVNSNRPIIVSDMQITATMPRPTSNNLPMVDDVGGARKIQTGHGYG